jgi:tetratricopeptide (TPR) repeat protein
MRRKLIFYLVIFIVVLGQTDQSKAEKGANLLDKEGVVIKHLLNARMALCEGNVDQALAEYQLIVEKYPYSEFADDAQLRIGRCLVSKGIFTKAIEEFKKVLKLYPNGTLLDNLWLDFIAPIKKDSRLEKLIGGEKGCLLPPGMEGSYKLYCAYYQRFPNFTADEARLNIAKVYYYNLQNYEKAIEEIEKILSKYPGGKRVFNDRKFAASSTQASLIERICRPEKEALYILGCLYLEKKDYDKSISCFQKYIEIYPEDHRLSVIHKYLGNCYREKKELTLAFQEYKTALDLEYKFLKRTKLEDKTKGVTRSYNSFEKRISNLKSIIKEIEKEK